MNQEAIVTLIVAAGGLAASWGAWVSVSIFKQAQEIALLKQQIELLKQELELLKEVKDVLGRISDQLAAGATI